MELKKFQAVTVREDGQPAPTHYSGECPGCSAPIKGVLPADVPSAEIECGSCHRKFRVAHA